MVMIVDTSSAVTTIATLPRMVASCLKYSSRLSISPISSRVEYAETSGTAAAMRRTTASSSTPSSVATPKSDTLPARPVAACASASVIASECSPA